MRKSRSECVRIRENLNIQRFSDPSVFNNQCTMRRRHQRRRLKKGCGDLITLCSRTPWNGCSLASSFTTENATVFLEHQHESPKFQSSCNIRTFKKFEEPKTLSVNFTLTEGYRGIARFVPIVKGYTSVYPLSVTQMTCRLSSSTHFYHFILALCRLSLLKCGRSARPTSCRRVPPHHSGGGVGPASVWGQGSAPISRWTRCGKSWRFAAVTRGGESPSRAPCHRRAVHSCTTRTLRWSLSAALTVLAHSSLFSPALPLVPSLTRTLTRIGLPFSSP